MRTPASFDRLRTAYAALPPRTAQFLNLVAIAGGVVGLLWIVFTVGRDDTRARTSVSGEGQPTPTHVDLMAPGAQMRDTEVWIGQAGRRVDRVENALEEQRRINREREEAEKRLRDEQMRQQEAQRAAEQRLQERFAELESRLRGPAPAAASPQPAPPPPPAAAAGLPPAGAIPRPPGTLPPPPPIAQPAGPLPAAPVASPTAHPPLVRVTVAAAAPPDKTGAGQGSARTASKHVSAYLPVSFVRGTLLGGLDAPTGGQAQSNPHPVLIRLADNAFLPNRFRAEYRECFVVAAGYGDISSERAYLRTESLSCVRPDGSVLEVRIQGSVYGEDGKVGMRGRLVTKQGQMLANALMAGVVGGFAQAVASYNTTFSYSALGSVATTSGKDAVYAGLGAGVSSALDRLADYYIRLAEQVFPVIEVDAGREIDVVITRGVVVEDGPAAPLEPVRATRVRDPAATYPRAGTDEE